MKIETYSRQNTFSLTAWTPVFWHFGFTAFTAWTFWTWYHEFWTGSPSVWTRSPACTAGGARAPSSFLPSFFTSSFPTFDLTFLVFK